MQDRTALPGAIGFGPFMLDVDSGELHKGSHRLRVPDQSIEILKALLERPGALVTREELRERLWTPDTFVDFEAGLNAAVKRLRDALGDSADAPRFIETLPRRGYRFIGVFDGSSDLASGVPMPAADTAAPRPRQRTARIVVLTAAALMVVSLAGIWITQRWSTGIADDYSSVPVTTYPGQEVDPALSPDGKHVAFAWNAEAENNFDIYVKRIDGDERQRLTTDAAADRRPTWSPDGQRIAFLRGVPPMYTTSKIFMVPAFGGPEQQVLDLSLGAGMSSATGLSWTPDGSSLLFVDRVGTSTTIAVFVCSLDTRARRQLTAPSDGFSDAAPAMSRDGRHLAFLRRNSGFSAGRVFVQPLRNLRAIGEPHELTFADTAVGLDWTPNSRSIVFANDSGLWRVPASGGQPDSIHVSAGLYSPSLARAGRRLLFQRQINDWNIWRLPGPNGGLSPASSAIRIIASTRADRSPQFSHDGRRIVWISNRSGTPEVWVSDNDGAHPVQVTRFGGAFVGSPRWSPDGEWIAFDSMRAGTYDIYVVSAQGGEPRRVTAESSSDFRPSWSHDGRWIYFGSNRSGREQIWKIPAGGGPATQLTERGGLEPFESVDGHYVYYAKVGSGPGIWRVPAGGGEEIRVVDSGLQGSWALTERGIVLMEKRSKPASIDFYDFDSRSLTRVAQLPAGLRLDANNPSLAVTHDGRWMLYVTNDRWGSDIEMIDNVR